MYKNLEDYGIIGNLETCALVARDGSIDWLCLPQIDSPSVFAAILDEKRGGRFSLHPTNEYESVQSYIKNTNILQTIFSNAFGKAIITDFMNVASEDGQRAIYRKVVCQRGDINLSLKFDPRFNYGQNAPAYSKVDGGVLVKNENETLFLQSSIPLAVGPNDLGQTIEMKNGQVIWFVLQYGSQNHISPEDCEKKLVRVKEYWVGWRDRCDPISPIIDEQNHELIIRSGLILKLLTNPRTGAIAAAPTTSLPERIGGVRNWDYRYSWIRDASFTVQALYHLGHIRESKEYYKWIENIVQQAQDPADILIMYPLNKGTSLEEKTLENLSGYRDSSPVRVGNDAAKQKQLDIYGELIHAIYETTRNGAKVSRKTWKFIERIANYVCDAWQTEDSGIWEVRGGARHFTYSKLMCWVAIDRAIRIAEADKIQAPLDKWVKANDEIKAAILEKGFNKKLNSFVQSFGSDTLDATSLLIPLMDFLSPEDSRVQGTIDATLKYLTTKNGLIYRYKAEDGLPGTEGNFILCSFWLVKALALSDRVEEAEKVFNNILKHISPLGLFAEEIDADTSKQLGNFPQAFSHIGLINSALYLGLAKGKAQKGPKLVGVS